MRRRPRAAEGGASAVEFALVLPVLVVVIGAIIDFGFVFAQQITLNTAARDAARSGVTKGLTENPATCTKIAERARTATGSGAGAIGVGNPSTVKVVVSLVDGVTTTEKCRLDIGSASATGAGGSLPCTSSSSAARIQVTVQYASQPPFPVPFMSTIGLTSRGDFTCEYT